MDFVFFRDNEMGRSDIIREESMKFWGAVAELHMGRNCPYSLHLYRKRVSIVKKIYIYLGL